MNPSEQDTIGAPSPKSKTLSSSVLTNKDI